MLSMFRRPIEPAREAVATSHYPEAVALCEQVRALGMNMNQIAHHVNATGQLDDVPELRELYREIKAVFARIILGSIINGNARLGYDRLIII